MDDWELLEGNEVDPEQVPTIEQVWVGVLVMLLFVGSLAAAVWALLLAWALIFP